MPFPAPVSSPSTPRSARSTIACPTAWRSSPASVVVAPLGPRQLIGVAWEAERLPTEEVGDNRLRPLAGAARRAADRRAAAPPRRMDRRLLSRAARRGAADGAAVVGRARRAAAADRISADRASSPTA